MKKTYVYYSQSLLVGLLSLQTLSACGNMRGKFGMGGPLSTTLSHTSTTLSPNYHRTSLQTVPPMGAITELPNSPTNLAHYAQMLKSSKLLMKECDERFCLEYPTYRCFYELIFADGCPANLLEKLIKEDGLDVNIQGFENHKQPLIDFGVIHKRPDVIKVLIDHGAKFSEKASSFIDWVLTGNDLETLQLMLNNGVKLDKNVPYIYNLLRYTGHNGVYTMYDLSGYTGEKRQDEGDRKKLFDMIECLAAHGANIDLSNDRTTPFQEALLKGDDDLAHFLAKHGADVNHLWVEQTGAPYTLHRVALDETFRGNILPFMQYIKNIDQRWTDSTFEHVTALQLAVKKAVEEHRMNGDTSVIDNEKPLMKFIKLLINAGADPNASWKQFSDQVTTPLQFAMENNVPALAKFLEEQGAVVQEAERSWFITFCSSMSDIAKKGLKACTTS